MTNWNKKKTACAISKKSSVLKKIRSALFALTYSAAKIIDYVMFKIVFVVASII